LTPVAAVPVYNTNQYTHHKGGKHMIFGMPTISFLAFLSWPLTFTVTALIIYYFMAKQDALTDDSEFEGEVKH
jgi:hypothetical protein